MRVLLVVLVMGSVAFAAPSKTIEGYTIAIDNGKLMVRKGTGRALLATRHSFGDAFKSFAFDKQTKTVSLEAEDTTCAGSTKYRWTLAHLDARLANDAALALHMKKDHANAAVGFAKATAADPTWNLAAYNLASAKQVGGDPAGAVAALAPWLASEPITTYVQVTTDPELAPLLARPELRALQAKQPGTAKLTYQAIQWGNPYTVSTVLYAPERGLIALLRHDARWVATYVDLMIFDAKTGVLVAEAPIVSPDNIEMGPGKPTAAGRKIIDGRIAKLQPMLVELGFVPAKIEKGAEVDGPHKRRFAKAKLGVVAKDLTVNALRGNTRVGTVNIQGNMLDALFVEDSSTAIVTSHRHSAEGCDGGPEAGVYLMPVTP